MAHYAFIKNNIVQKVIVGVDEDTDGIDWEKEYGKRMGMLCKRTSYNGSIRANYAGIGYTYDETNDVFIAPEPVVEGKTFTLNTTKWIWEEDE
tara:strand:- start:47 stop:325 length:279 start_codon:yes stop_codon:yes gene_type:complete